MINQVLGSPVALRCVLIGMVVLETVLEVQGNQNDIQYTENLGCLVTNSEQRYLTFNYIPHGDSNTDLR